MRLKSIASGSSGNSIYVGTDNAHILVDAGISGKRIEQGLAELGITGSDLDGILITHEHSDHIQGLGVMARRYGIPIYSTRGTLEEIIRSKSIGNIDTSLLNELAYDSAYKIKDITFNTIKISHDAAAPVAYSFEHEGKKAAIITDLGMYDDYIKAKISGLDAIYLEANHDVRMLQLGRYPYALKKRILGDRGHLSNEAAGKLLADVLHDDMKYIVLSHLSQENNIPDLAYEAVRLEVTMGQCPYKADDFDIMVAKRNEPSRTLVV